MFKIFLVAQREYFENVKTKGFWIGIILVPFFLILSAIVPAWLERGRAAQRYAVIDQSGWLAEAVAQKILREDLQTILITLARQTAQGEDPTKLPVDLQQTAQLAQHIGPGGLSQAVEVGLNPNGRQPTDETIQQLAGHIPAIRQWWQSLTNRQANNLIKNTSRARFEQIHLDQPDQTTLNNMIIEEELHAYLVIGPDPIAGDQGFKYISNNLTDDDLREWYSRHSQDIIRDRRLQREQLDPNIVSYIQTPLQYQGRMVSQSGQEKEVQAEDTVSQWAPVAFVYILWISIFGVVMKLLTNTVTEKSNRLIEVLLSSISPIQLMGGKIAGIAATGLTMVGTWAITFIIAVGYLPQLLGVQSKLNISAIASNPIYLASFLIYFLLGYLFYAAVLVAIGSLCDNLKDAQNASSPVTMMLFIPMLLMIPVGRDPNGIIARVFSYLPPFTPFAMMNRAAGPPPMIDYILTTLLLIVSIILTTWAAAKIFRTGILLTGKPPSIREVLRWLKAPVGSAKPSQK